MKLTLTVCKQFDAKFERNESTTTGCVILTFRRLFQEFSVLAPLCMEWIILTTNASRNFFATIIMLWPVSGNSAFLTNKCHRGWELSFSVLFAYISILCL